MRILRIAGENIASLQSFDVDLQAPPLGGAGLFTITGPTGAGKTTILDALCLALFDNTPRLAAGSRVRPARVDGESVDSFTEQDPRSLLRRGAVSGWAEVDFVGVDAGTYRARWAVRRSYNKASGPIQKPTVSLVNLDSGAELGSNKKTETLDLIQAKLGLRYEQFCRSALLPQGEFAAFLRASQDDRAALLEAMTGTEEYARIGRAAFERDRDARRVVERCEQRLADLELLDDEARAALSGSITEHTQAVETATSRAETAQAWLRWHQDRQALQEQLTKAQAELTRAQEAHGAAAERRAAVARVRAAAPLRVPLAAVDDAQAALSRARSTLGRLEQERSEAAGVLAQRQSAVTVAKDHAAGAQAARVEAQPALQQARVLDAQLVDLHHTLEVRAKAAAEAAEQVQAAERAQQLAAATLQRLQRRRDTAQTWLDEHAIEVGIAGTRGTWEPVLERLLEDFGERTRQEAAVSRLEAPVRDATATVHRLTKAHAEARAAVGAARATLELARAAVQAAPLQPLLEQLRSANERLGGLKDLQRRVAAHRSAHEERSTVTQSAQRAEQQRQEAVSQEAAHTRDATALQGQLTEAQRTRARVDARRGLSSRRADLQHGEPCPLCGATEHPFAGQDVLLDELWEEAESRVREVEQALKAATDGAQRARLSAGKAQATRDAARQEASKLSRTIDTLEAELRELRASLQVEPGAGRAALQEARAAAERLDGQVRAAQAAQERRDQADKAFERAQTKEDTAREAVERAQDDHRAAAQALQDARARATSVRDRVDERLADLEVPFAALPGWRASLHQDPGGFAQARRESANRVARRQDTLARLGPEIAAAQGIETRHRTTIEERRAQQATRTQERDEAAAAVQAAQERRAAVLGGEPADVVSGRLDAAVSSAEAALEAARAQVRGAQGAAQALEGRCAAAREAQGQADQRLAEARARLESALHDARLDEASARAVLSRSEAWVQDEERALRQLDTAVSTAQGVEKDRRRAQADHLVGPTPGPLDDHAAPSQDTAEAILGEARQAQEHHAEQRAQARAALQADDNKRAAAAERTRALTEAKASAAVWARLNQLLGSADGKRFRKVAQSFTLEALLLEANRFLLELAPRYRLQRIPGSGLDLQIVDLDLADEVRSVQSLSGGEGFLVSLALALGLSALSAQDVAVRTLFIDEGFGTLDPHVLELALQTLEQLQEGGRQVGLISHVPGLADRVGAQVRVEPVGNGISRVRV